ncbi:hypothetical protein EV421DRAFT_2025244 [Armillaria borealis]|uniref:Uncharacterized protein n=1 Tax=Armillaria borealis TaxID=47425 RepID=A0AA39IUU0_9AGAR|nr:hypothetical protein EV421DRAFT_2025244 [Armillaria borealis]
MPPMSPRYTRLTAGLKLWTGFTVRPQCPVLLERDPLEPSNDYIQRQSVLPPRNSRGRLGHKLGMITRPCFESEEELASPVHGMATGTSVLQNTNALHNELSEQLAQMATQLKCNALHFSDSLSADKAIVEEAQQKIESNFNFMRKERKTSGTFASIL